MTTKGLHQQHPSGLMKNWRPAEWLMTGNRSAHALMLEAITEYIDQKRSAASTRHIAR